MENPIYEESYRNHTIKIIHDPDPESPRDYDNLGTMTCWHHRYNLGDKHDHSDPRELLIDLCDLTYETDLSTNALFERASRRAVILPLYLYDHSGITMKHHGVSLPVGFRPGRLHLCEAGRNPQRIQRHPRLKEPARQDC